MSQRIKAEFHAEDLYLAYQVFDVDSWSQILSDSTPDARWDASARKLCEALGMRHDRWAWVAAAKIALALKSGWVNKQGASASTPGCSATIDNRLVWRAALGSVSFPSSLAPAVRFYLATWDGAGAIERGVGPGRCNPKAARGAAC